jgi:formylglycine-generating enzyme required for sulfatase activity
MSGMENLHPALGSKRTPSAYADDAAAGLFQDFALQTGFVSQQQVFAWRQQRETSNSSLAEYLLSRGELESDDCRLLEELVERASKRGITDLQVAQRAASSPTPQPKDSETVSFHGPRKTDQTVLARIGDYEILSEIARGGMGVVYRAKQTKLNRLVALKVIRAGEFADAGEIARFRVEATAAAGLDHPHIVPVYEVGQADGRHFFSMALVDGESLHAKVLRDGPFTASRGAALLLQAARGVHFANEKGIIHRDLKPHNLLLDRAEAIRVADFGLAKNMGNDSDLTSTGQVMGTPCYMAPEQAAGNSAEVVAASDVYSLGATLYFMLTARPPFQAGSPVETIRQVLEASPLPPRKLNPAIPRDLETICLHCLRKEPAKRYASAGELANDLERWLASKPIVARPVRVAEKLWLAARRQPWVAVSVAAILLTIVGAGGIAWQQRRANTARIAAAALQNDQARAAAHVDSLLAAPATGVPFALQLIEPLAEHALPLLLNHFHDPTAEPNQRLRAAIALSLLGKPQTEYLLNNIPTAPVAECRNLIAALDLDKEATTLLVRQVQALTAEPTPDWETKARFAIVALYLGDPSLAIDMCSPRADLIQRTTFAERWSQWHGDWATLLKVARNLQDDALLGTLLLGMGDVAPDELSPDALAAWKTWLTDLHRQNADPWVHSACRYVGQQWRLELPEHSPSKEGTATNRWLVNHCGMTLIRCEPGSFTRKILEAGATFQQEVRLTRPFYLAQQETSAANFRRFLADQYPDPADVPREFSSDSPFGKLPADAPACSVSWDDAARFCNWLSAHEQLEPAYLQAEGVWSWQATANGYRLPTAAEWEYTCRANTATTYYFGNDANRLSRYVIYNAVQPAACGSLPPNSWGFFEMLGNVHEWCFDPYERESSPSLQVIDPIGKDQQRGRVLMGGSFQNGPTILNLALRHSGNSQGRSEANGFRVARTATEAATTRERLRE